LLDDENDNKKMDYNWFGLPQEGYGFSNNEKASIAGAPSYNACIVDLQKTKTIKIAMQYWN